MHTSDPRAASHIGDLLGLARVAPGPRRDQATNWSRRRRLARAVGAGRRARYGRIPALPPPDREGCSARACWSVLRDALGPDRLMWGSDWPHTQFETAEDYAGNRRFLDALVTDQKERAALLAAPFGLFRF